MLRSLMLVTFFALALSNLCSAGEVESAALVKGEYKGRWHGDAVHYIFEKVSTEGDFNGIVRFDKGGRFEDRTFVFAGKLEKDGSITIKRDPKDDEQVSHAKAPKEVKGQLVWDGNTTGPDLDKKVKFPFELHVPVAKK